MLVELKIVTSDRRNTFPKTWEMSCADDKITRDIIAHIWSSPAGKY